jgi:hypothetical protein
MSEGAACRANINAAGRRFRRRLGWLGFVVSAAFGVATVALRLSDAWRALAFLPLAGGTFSWLEARRSTCVVFAADGTRELESGGREAAPEDDARASRVAARGIARDAVLVGLAGVAALWLVP